MAQTRSTLVTFELGDVRLAVDATRVREVVRAVAITALPGAPAVVEGVIDVRGETIPVFDMRQRFGLAARGLRPADYFVVVDAGERRAALHVDAPGWLTEVPADALTPARRLTKHARHVAGTVRLEDGIVAIHDVATFLSRAEADALDAALGARHGEVGHDALPGGGAEDRRDA